MDSKRSSVGKLEKGRRHNVKRVITLKKDKETKNKFRYAEVAVQGEPPLMETLYLPKYLSPPPTITVVVEWEDT